MNKKLFKKYLDISHQVATLITAVVLNLVVFFFVDFTNQEQVNTVICYTLLFVITAHKD